MEIYISKITFEDAGNSGGGGITTPCYITEELQGYSEKEMQGFNEMLSDYIKTSNKILECYNNFKTTSYNTTFSIIDDGLMLIGNSTIYFVPIFPENPKIKTIQYGRSGYNRNMVEYIPNINIDVFRPDFSYCYQLKKIEGITEWDGNKFNSVNDMFNYCTSLTSLDLSGWKKNTGWTGYGTRNIWSNCTSLTYLNISGWDFTSCSTGSYASPFANCTNLVDLVMDGTILKDYNTNWFGTCTALSVDSLVGILNALPTTTKGYTLTLGTTNLNKLSDEQKAIATNKGWVLA